MKIASVGLFVGCFVGFSGLPDFPSLFKTSGLDTICRVCRVLLGIVGSRGDDSSASSSKRSPIPLICLDLNDVDH